VHGARSAPFRPGAARSREPGRSEIKVELAVPAAPARRSGEHAELLPTTGEGLILRLQVLVQEG
jgi:hypothetical protein